MHYPLVFIYHVRVEDRSLKELLLRSFDLRLQAFFIFEEEKKKSNAIACFDACTDPSHFYYLATFSSFQAIYRPIPFIPHEILFYTEQNGR